MKTKFTFETIRESIVKIFQRFPITASFSIALTMELLLFVSDCVYKGLLFVYWFATGFLLSFMLELWGEEIQNRKLFQRVAVASHVVLFADFLYLWTLDIERFDHASLWISFLSVEISLILGIFLLPFFKQKSDVPSWNFVRTLIPSTLLCQFVGVAMAVGICILLFCINALFNLNFSFTFYGYNVILCTVLISQFLFLSRIPDKETLHKEEIHRSGFLEIVTSYLFFPLVVAYMVVLYIYLFKILFTWTLPQGAVTYCVSAMMGGIIIVQFLLYPTLRSEAARSYERLASRWMPILALPLVALMTIGLIRRFSDYGITAGRLYALTLNLWFYAVCLLMWFTQCRRIHWISLSFVALLLLTSVQPYNYMELTRLSMRSSLEKTISAYPPSRTPMSSSEFAAWIDSLPEEEQQSTYSKFRYISEWCMCRSDLNEWICWDVFLNRDLDNFKSQHGIGK